MQDIKDVDNLKKYKAMLEASIESPKDMQIVFLDKNYNYLYFNEAHRKALLRAYNKEPKIGQYYFDFIANSKDARNIKKRIDHVF